MPPRQGKATKVARKPGPKAGKTSPGAPVSSVIGSLFQAIKTARLEIPERVAVPGPARAATKDELVQHLAALLHGAYLVTLVERAQLGAPVGVAARTEGPVSGATPTEASPAAAAITTVDERWLNAVVQYCHFTVTLDDLAKVAEAFPQYLSVRWSIKPTHSSVTAALAAALDEQVTALTPSRSPNRKRLRASAHSGRHEPTAGAGSLVARLSVYQRSVPSVEEAVAALDDAIKSKGTAMAQRAWRTHLSQLTAYSAFLLQHPLVSTGNVDAEAESTRRSGSAVRSGEHRVDATAESAGDAEPTLSAEEVALLEQLSPELRGALSRRKLSRVLHEMKRERDRDDAKENAEIHQRQIRERLMSTFEHLLALCGPKRRTFGAWQLLQTLRSESLFPEHRNLQEQLSVLVALKESGVTAQTVTAQGVEPVEHLENMSAEGLASVMITVDPQAGSIQGTLDRLMRDSGVPTS